MNDTTKGQKRRAGRPPAGKPRTHRVTAFLDNDTYSWLLERMERFSQTESTAVFNVIKLSMEAEIAQV
jgi:hypothetical protein